MSKPREFWVWPKYENSFFGEILSNEDYESAINPHCLKLSFKVIEYSAYQKLQKENEILREALEFYADGDGDVLDWDRVNNSACIQDRGKHAREALEKVSKK